MDIRICSQIDYVSEGYELLCLLAKGAGEHIEKIKKAVSERYQADPEHTKRCIQLTELITDRAGEVFSDRMKEIGELFGVMEEKVLPAELLVCTNDLLGEDARCFSDGSDLLAYYRSLTEEERDGWFLKSLEESMEQEEFFEMVGNAARGIHVDDAVRLRNIFSRIQKTDLTYENKARVQEFYLNRDSYMEVIASLLDTAAVLLREFREQMLAVCKTWERYWRAVAADGRFFARVDRIVAVGEEKKREGALVMPGIVNSGTFYVLLDEGLMAGAKQRIPVFRIGAMIIEDIDWESPAKEEYRLNELVPVWKALGEQSKAEILMFVRDRPAYGSEIAKKFGLTTATVSHHMNRLLNLRLVQAELRDGKVYYQVRKERLAEVFEQSRKLFGGV